MNERRAIMAVVNHNYIHPLKMMWTSLFRTNLYDLDFYLFHEDLSQEDVQELMAFASRWENKNIIFMHMGKEEVSGLPVTEEFPKEIYYKFTGLDHLPKKLEQVLCMDLDMIVRSDISDVFSVNVSSYGIAACSDVFGKYFGLSDNNLDCLSLRHDRPYFNAGFMLFSLGFMRQIGGGRAIIKLAHLHKGKLYYPEQDILNLIFHDSFLELPWDKYNCPPIQYVMDKDKADAGILEPLEFSAISSGAIPEGYLDYTKAIYDNASVIHYMGGTKPWRQEREKTPVYDIFDEAYTEILNES